MSELSIINSIIKKEKLQKLDEYQNNSGIYKLFLELHEEIKEKMN